MCQSLLCSEAALLTVAPFLQTLLLLNDLVCSEDLILTSLFQTSVCVCEGAISEAQCL